VLEPAYSEKRAFDTFLITLIMLQMRICSDADCRSQNCFSENEHFKHQLAEMLKLLHFTAELSVLCLILIGVVLGLNGTSCIACVSAVCILYGLCKVEWQSGSSPFTVDCKEKQKLNI